MRYANRLMLVLLFIAMLQLAGCGSAPPATEDVVSPVRIERIEGSELSRVILTEDAAKRIGIETVAVRDTQAGGKTPTTIPYAAVLYDAQGETWTYTNPSPLTFIRHRIAIASIAGGIAMLSEALPSGTQVVIVGAEELFGSEFEFEE
jgi:uncharacterized protein YcfL